MSKKNNNSTKPILYGANYSVYVRIVLLALLEKQIEFDHQEIDIFAKDGISNNYLTINPFGKIPTFTDNDITLYETSAITRYIEDHYKVPPSLLPDDAVNKARVNQIISILDNYAYKTLVWGIYVESCETEKPDFDKIALAADQAGVCLLAIEEIMTGESHLIDGRLSLADLYAAPMFDYFQKSPQGQEMLPSYPKLNYWWQSVQTLPCWQKLLVSI